MNHSTQLLACAILLFVSVSFNAQIVIEDFDDCGADPQYTVNPVVGNGEVFPIELEPGNCGIEVDGGPGFSVTEILFPPLDLNLFGLQPGEPVNVQFTINYDGENPINQGVLKLIILDPFPMEIWQFDLGGLGEDASPQVQLPDAGIFGHDWGFVLEGNDTSPFAIDDVAIWNFEDPCTALSQETQNFPIVPEDPEPCLTYIGRLVSHVSPDGLTPCPEHSTVTEDINDYPGVVRDEQLFFAASISGHFLFEHFWLPRNCDDGNDCTYDTCDLETDACVHTPYWLNQYNSDIVDPEVCLELVGIEVIEAGQVLEAFSTLPPGYVAGPLDEEQTVYGFDGEEPYICEWSVRYVWTPRSCDDGDPCTIDSCNPITGLCEHVYEWDYYTDVANVTNPGPCYDQYLGYQVVVNFGTPEQQILQELSTITELVGLFWVSTMLDLGLNPTDAMATVHDPLSACNYAVIHFWLPKNCDDGDPCTKDACNSETGECVNTPLWQEAADNPGEAQTCEDYLGYAVYDPSFNPVLSSVSEEVASSGGLREEMTYGGFDEDCPWIVEHFFGPKDCSDGDACTLDSCDEQGNCQHEPIYNYLVDEGHPGSEPCEYYAGIVVYQAGAYIPAVSTLGDGDQYLPSARIEYVSFINTEGADECILEWWHVYLPIPCDDGDPCTLDTCDPITGECVHQPVMLNIIPDSAPATCPNYSNGSVSVVVEGDRPPYEVSLQKLASDGPGDILIPSSSELWEGLDVGIYRITAFDAGGCMTQDYVEVTKAPDPDAEILYGDPSCWDISDGEISLWLNNYASPATVVLYKNNGNGQNDQVSQISIGDDGILPNTATFEGLGRGTYTLVATDGNGCEVTNVVNLSSPFDQLEASVYSNTPDCPGVLGASISINATGGAGPGYEYTINEGMTWEAGSSAKTFTGLGSGVYFVQVRDASGCESEEEAVHINVPGNWAHEVNAEPTTCHDHTDGSVRIEWTGGTRPYSISFEGQTTSPATTGAADLMDNADSSVGIFSADNLSSGEYALQITDARGCVHIINWVIAAPSAMDVEAIFAESTTGTNGEIVIWISGGTPGYTHEWTHNGQLISTSKDIENLEPGQYQVTIFDSNQCILTETFEVGGTPLELDTDGDGLSDWSEENLHGTDPNNPDSDGDMIPDGEEVNVYGTDPINNNTDGDLHGDGSEILFTLTDPLAYNPFTTALEGGCTYLDAENFNPTADFDNSSCLFEECQMDTCANDVNGDGQINTGDLLSILGGFGAPCVE